MGWIEISQKPSIGGFYLVYAESGSHLRWPEICSAYHVALWDGMEWWHPLKNDISHWKALPNKPDRRKNE